MRDIEAVRQTILSLQNNAPPEGRAAVPEWHQRILKDEGLLDVFDESRIGDPNQRRVIGLTAEGQRFSEAIRDEAQWNDVIAMIEADGSPMTIHEIRRRVLMPS